MEYVKDSIYNTSLPILIIDEKKGSKEYPQIGWETDIGCMVIMDLT